MESLDSLARHAFEQAPLLCAPRQGCCDYHRIWGLARLASPDGPELAGAAFLREELARHAASLPAPRVLISGGADGGLLALVDEALQSVAASPRLLFVDRCATAVEVNQRLAGSLAAEVSLFQGDILDFTCEPVDLIVAHSFLNFFTPALRRALFLRWADLLKAGGRILLSNKLAQQARRRPARPDAAELQRHAQALEQVAERLCFDAGDRDALVAAHRRVLRKAPAANPGITAHELESHLGAAGLQLIRLTLHDRDGPRQRGPLVLAPGDDAVRAELVLGSAGG